MEPLLKANDKLMFYKFLDKASVYFEYGSGGSTYQANIRNNITNIYSVESDVEWSNKLQKLVTSDKVFFIFNEMDTRSKSWGRPGPNATDVQKIRYSNHIRSLNKEKQQKIDLILIDGRFRVACCLKCFDVIKSDCFIAFDDFLNRTYYHIILNYYDIIEKTDNNCMVILQKKKNISSIPEYIIKKYELIQE